MLPFSGIIPRWPYGTVGRHRVAAVLSQRLDVRLHRGVSWNGHNSAIQNKREGQMGGGGMLRHVSRMSAAVLSREDGLEAFPSSFVRGMRLPP